MKFQYVSLASTASQNYKTPISSGEKKKKKNPTASVYQRTENLYKKPNIRNLQTLPKPPLCSSIHNNRTTQFKNLQKRKEYSEKATT